MHIASRNNFPTAAGLASSAAGFAALVSSLAALCAMLATVAALYGFGLDAIGTLFAVMTVISFVMHRTNIARLVAGSEGRIGERR